MNKLTIKRRSEIIGALVEGNSIRATCRMTGAAKGTVLKLLEDVGQACFEYQDTTLRNLTCKRLQCDEIWSFCYAKQRNLSIEMSGKLGFGDVWTWTALCADTKLIAWWHVGKRDGYHAEKFMRSLASRLQNRIQLSSDGHKAYVEAVKGAFGKNIDYAILDKIYGAEPEPQKRYSPASCIGVRTKAIIGNPDRMHVSTSYVERQNLTMRMQMRRFTRLTNAFSKKIENLNHAVALHFMYYNFARIHKSLRVTPAMEAGISDHVWSLEEIAALSK